METGRDGRKASNPEMKKTAKQTLAPEKTFKTIDPIHIYLVQKLVQILHAVTLPAATWTMYSSLSSQSPSKCYFASQNCPSSTLQTFINRQATYTQTHRTHPHTNTRRSYMNIHAWHYKVFALQMMWHRHPHPECTHKPVCPVTMSSVCRHSSPTHTFAVWWQVVLCHLTLRWSSHLMLMAIEFGNVVIKRAMFSSKAIT